MKIVKPWIEIKQFDGVQLMKNLELAAKQCYRTQSNITEDSYKHFLRNCISRGHESVIEHEKVSIKMKVDVGCYSKDTMVLTTNGWKYFKDIDVTTDRVYTKDDNNNVMEYPIMSLIEKHYTGKLLNFKNNIIDLLVTPDHNMWVKDENKRSSKTKIWKFLQAQDLKNKSYIFDRHCNSNLTYGRSIDVLPSISYNNKYYSEFSIKNNELFFELLGWYITDGSLEKTGNYIRCRISQIKQAGRTRIEYILNELGIDYSVSDVCYTIKLPQLNHFIYNNFYCDDIMSKSLSMFIPSFIKEAFSNEILSFINGVIGGNGYHKKSGTTIIYTGSNQFAMDLIELLFKVGKNANFYPTPNLNKYNKSYKQNHIVYAVSIHKNQSITWWNKNDNNYSEVDYDDKVYCLELAEYHRLFIMRNGKTCWCGNCYKDLTRHRHASFSIESTRYCVAGSTKLTFKNPHNRYTVAELYNMVQNSKNGSWKKIEIRQLDENTGKLQYSNIKNIYKTGIKKCYKIVTDLHYELVCTLDHQIYTPNGYMKLQDLKINDYIYVDVENKSLDTLYADKIIAIEYVGDLEVYDIEMNNDNHNFVANGVIVHNCNYSKDKFDNEIKFIEPCNIEKNTEEYNAWYYCMQDIEETYLKMSSLGCKPDQLRLVLPHSTAAEVYMTANMREWRHIFSLRAQKETHPAVQQVMIPLLLYFKEQMPELFDEIPYNEDFDSSKYAEIKII